MALAHAGDTLKPDPVMKPWMESGVITTSLEASRSDREVVFAAISKE